MDFNQCVNKAVDDVVQKFLSQVASQYDIEKQDLQSLWSGQKQQSTSQKRSRVVAKPETTAVEDVSEDQDSDSVKSLDMDSLQKSTVQELKALCKQRGLKVSGKKSDLLDRLITGKNSDSATATSTKSAKPKNVKKKVDTKDVIKQLKANSSSSLQVRRNAFGNYQHPHSALLFNCDGKVYGVQNDDGSVEPLTQESIDICNKYKLQFVIPENLDVGKGDSIDIDDIEDDMEDDIEDDKINVVSEEEEGDLVVSEEEDIISEGELLGGEDEEEDEIPLEDDDEEFY